MRNDNNLSFVTLKHNNKSTSAIISLNEGGRLKELVLNNKTVIKEIASFKYSKSYASSVLFPFASRIENGKYTFKNKEYKLDCNDSNKKASIICFDDLGTESNLKYFGNECNVMGEILLRRYDAFTHPDQSRRTKTHLTTNLSASEIEQYYGNRIRSRLRESFNLIAFNNISRDNRR
jgi:DNA replication protein DnaC